MIVFAAVVVSEVVVVDAGVAVSVVVVVDAGVAVSVVVFCQRFRCRYKRCCC